MVTSNASQATEFNGLRKDKSFSVLLCTSSLKESGVLGLVDTQRGESGLDIRTSLRSDKRQKE